MTIKEMKYLSVKVPQHIRLKTILITDTINLCNHSMCFESFLTEGSEIKCARLIFAILKLPNIFTSLYAGHRTTKPSILLRAKAQLHKFYK